MINGDKIHFVIKKVEIERRRNILNNVALQIKDTEKKKSLLEMVKEYDNILRFVDLISKNELTEFEKKLWFYLSRANLGKYKTSDDKVGKQYVINCSKELLSIARKQIVNQIDVDAMIDAYDEENGRLNITSGIYRMGIEDTLDIIKSEKLK